MEWIEVDDLLAENLRTIATGAVAAASPLGSTTTADPLHVKRCGIRLLRPLPEPVGATQIRV